MKKYAIIVAGGRGMRMGAALPKQYLPIGGKPILMHTLSHFHEHPAAIELILVIPDQDIDFWEQLCREHDFKVPHRLVSGGTTRFQSVKNGLDAIADEDGLVAIHDGVRPFVTEAMISMGYFKALEAGSAVAVVPLKDSLRKLDRTGGSSYQNREEYRLVQTPQTFRLQKIKKAFEAGEKPDFTDDATVYEFQGWQVALITGDLSNIKITTPEDMAYAEWLLAQRKN